MNVEYLSYQALGKELRQAWHALKTCPDDEKYATWQELQNEALGRLDKQAEVLGLLVEEVSNL